MKKIDAYKLKNIFEYDQITGVLRWKYRDYVRPSWNTKYMGKIVGSIARNGYRKTAIHGKDYLVHIIIWAWMTGNWPSSQIDHRDTNRNNNKWNNLRLATTSQNMANMNGSSRNTSGFKGVSLKKQTGRYQATIRVLGKEIHLGYFDRKEDAAMAYKIASNKYFGEFGRAV